MPSRASLNPGERRAQRPAIAQLLSMWRALPGSVRRFASDFAAVFVQEGRRVSARVTWAALALAVAGILVLAGWLLVCAATVSWAVSAHGWPWERALYLAALLNLLLAVISIVAANRWLKSPFFPVTSYELHRLRSADGHAPPAWKSSFEGSPISNAGPKERALMRSEAELQARILQVKRVTPQLLTTPSVVAATAGAGLLLGLVTSKRKRQTTVIAGPAANVPATKQLVNVAFGQLSSLALAVALRELQRRAGHDR
jgi:MFS family permease